MFVPDGELQDTSLIERRAHSVRDWREQSRRNADSTILADLQILQSAEDDRDDDDDTLLVPSPTTPDPMIGDNDPPSYQSSNNINYLELQDGVLTYSKSDKTSPPNSGNAFIKSDFAPIAEEVTASPQLYPRMDLSNCDDHVS